MTWLPPTRRDLMPWIVITVGILLRFLPGLQSDFPINDGGMFLSMVRDLRNNNFILPATTSYNQSDIPFAYPPLGMYVTALVSFIVPISDLLLVKWIPAIVSATIVPVFYWFALQIFKDRTKAFVAVALAAFLPNSFDWLVMGGGLSRSFGILFFITASGFVLKTIRENERGSLWPATIFCGLAVLSHPEVGIQTAGISLWIWILYGRNLNGVKNAFMIAVGTALLTAAWWLTVLIQHGFAPFASAMQTGIRETLIASLFHSFFSLQGSLPVLPVLSSLGLFVSIRKKDWFLFGWAFLPFLIDPRNAPAVAMYAYILLAAEALTFVWIEITRSFGSSSGEMHNAFPLAKSLTGSIFGALIVFLFVSTFHAAQDLGRVNLSKADRDTMEWIHSNIPTESRFLLLTNAGGVNPMADAYQEWFPTLTERHSLNTLQGTEWKIGPDFFAYSLELMDLQTCEDVICMREWVFDQEMDVDYILVRTERIKPTLLASIDSDPELTEIYRTGIAAIYELK